MLGEFSGGQLTRPGLAGFTNVFRLHPLPGRFAGASAAYRLVDDVAGHIGQLALLGLADPPQLGERILGTTAGAAPDESDRLVDDGTGQQHLLQAIGEREGLRGIRALWTATAAGLANSSPSSAARGPKASLS